MWVYVGTGTATLGSYHQKLFFSARDRLHFIGTGGKMKLISCTLLCVAAILCAAIYSSVAKAVTAIPGVIQCVITLTAAAAVRNAGLIPDSITVEAVHSSKVYAAHAIATQGGAG